MSEPESTVPDSSTEVSETSAVEEGNQAGTNQPTGQDEAARLAGLHRAITRLKEENEALRANQSAITQATNSTNSTPPDNQTVDEPAPADLAAIVLALYEKDRQRDLDAARERVLNDNPKLKPFASLLVGDSPEEIASKAGEVVKALEGLEPKTENTPDADTPDVPHAPPIGGGAPPLSRPSDTAERDALLQRGDLKGLWQRAFSKSSPN